MIETVILDMSKKLSALPKEKVDSLNDTCKVDSAEHFAYQTLQSKAFASGKLSLDNAQWLYATLGGSADIFNRRSLAIRIVAITMIAKLV